MRIDGREETYKGKSNKKNRRKRHGLVWKGWHAYRRSLATNLKELGVEDTAVQCILRARERGTTQSFYIRTAPKVAHEAMRQLEAKIADTPKGPIKT